ncbi:LPS export ABC transporter permease LptG [Chitinibacter bivalviorum]|uniref:LPS export ABC transporter permease LptG n=1 Tax=Chitinibacter bivalviorum TaxID=2739434 RepID=A0A7H9BM14_9NEIS|nr:LPS export ABC transporter permease LptG [Chitinibacter bivalviorum]QLG89653.1 LPS export ABC transporter permease LptG [Chitinibacter bivalviorum]
MMNRLCRYVLSSLVWHVLLTMLVLLGLFVFFDLIAEMRDVGKGSYQFHHAFIYTLLEAPSRAYQLLPVSVLIGSIFALSSLADTSQITVMRAAGVSILRFCAWLALGGFFFGVATYLLGEYVAPAANDAATRYQVAAKNEVMFGRFQSGIWVKDGDQIVNISAMQSDLSVQALRIYVHDNGHHLKEIVDAQRGRHLGNGQWQLEEATLTRFYADKVEVSARPSYEWQTRLEPKMLAVLMVKPQDMSIDALRQYVDHLSKNKQSTVRYELALWAKLFYPFACLSMMLIALPFALGQRRSGNVGVKIFLGILLGVSFNFVNQMMSYVGELYRLPPILAAALPTLALSILAVYFLWQQENN